MKSMELQTQPSPESSSGEQPWLASYLLQRQVVNASTLEPVGRVADVAFDSESSRVTALIIQADPSEGGRGAAVRRVFGRRRTVASVGLDHIVALSGDVVTIDTNPVSTVFSELSQRLGRSARLCEVCELTILTLSGMCLGSLADLLLDGRGSTIIGYVINPTKQAELSLPLLEGVEGLEPSSPLRSESAAGAAGAVGIVDVAEASPANESSEASSARLRVIPASPRVRIGKALILVIEEVEPLRQETVVITSQSGEHARREVLHNGA